MPGTMLVQAQVVRRWCSMAGALEGCLRSLNIYHTPAFIMGASGHAFRISVEPTTIFRTGPTVIDFRGDHLPLYNNLGVRLELRQHWTDEPSYRAKQRVVWEAVRDSLEAARPAIVWDADIPEFGLVVGHDPRVGRYWLSTMPQPTPWQAIMNDVPQNVGMLRMFLPVERKNCDRRKAAHDSIAFAIRQSRTTDAYHEHLLGLAAYAAWIEALREGRTLDDPYSHAYTTAVVHEARTFVPPYLREVASLFEPPATAHIEQAAEHFDEVSAALTEVHRLFPMPQPGVRADSAALPAGVAALERASLAEQRGLDALILAFPELDEVDALWSSIA